MYEELQNILNYPLIRFGGIHVTLWTIFHFVIVILLVLILSRYVRNLLKERVLVRTRLEIGLQYGIARIAGYIVFVLGLFIGLETLGIDLTSFTVLAGAFGLGIGFGLQHIINNFVSGLILLSEHLIQVGDRIEVGGANGQLTKIGARSSIITTGENVMVVMPNSEFITNKVTNWGHGTVQKIRFDITIGVSYDSDLHLVEKILLEVADSNIHVLKSPASVVELADFGDSAINFKLYFWTIDMVAKSGALKSQLYFAIWDKFQQHQIDIPFPIHTIRMPTPIQVEYRNLPNA